MTPEQKAARCGAGEAHCNSRYTEGEVDAMRDMYASGIPATDIARASDEPAFHRSRQGFVSVQPGAISYITSRKTWRHLPLTRGERDARALRLLRAHAGPSLADRLQRRSDLLVERADILGYAVRGDVSRREWAAMGRDLDWLEAQLGRCEACGAAIPVNQRGPYCVDCAEAVCREADEVLGGGESEASEEVPF